MTPRLYPMPVLAAPNPTKQILLLIRLLIRPPLIESLWVECLCLNFLVRAPPYLEHLLVSVLETLLMNTPINPPNRTISSPNHMSNTL